MSKLLKGALGDIIGRRSSALKELEKEITAIAESEKDLTAGLLKNAPAEIKEWLEEDCIIDNLFKFGISSNKIRFHEDGFGDLISVKELIMRLSVGWDGVVSITLSNEPEAHRIGIRFAATM